MTTDNMKKEIRRSIEVVQSEELIKAIYLLLHAEVKHIKKAIRPLSMEEFYARHEKSQKDIKAGRLKDSSKLKAKYSTK